MIFASMEFLDPESKRARTLRLFAGYFLIAIVIFLSALILVYIAQGYNYDPSKGVRRDGLLFVDALPQPASISLNDQQKGTTDARLVLPEGRYDVKLTRDKYRDWSKRVLLEGGSVYYLIYPRLFPTDIPVAVTEVLDAAPQWVSQSPDRRWIVVKKPATDQALTLYDTSNNAEEPAVLALPFAVGPDIQPLEWSTDNRHLLVAWTADGIRQYAIIDREKPAESQNINSALNIAANAEVVLRNKKFDQFYIRDLASGDIRSATLADGIRPTIVVAGAVSFKAYAADTLLFVTYNGVTDQAKAAVQVLDRSNLYTLMSLPRDPANKYVLDTAKFKDNWYFVTGSASGLDAKVYINPLSRVRPGNTTPALPQLSLRVSQPQYVSFSENARIIAAQSGSAISTYDAEQKRQFRYTLPFPVDPAKKLPWMDGHRMQATSQGKTYIFEFDSENRQELGQSNDQFFMYFDRDYETAYTWSPRLDGKTVMSRYTLVVD